jgi:hypothetical protein
MNEHIRRNDLETRKIGSCIEQKENLVFKLTSQHGGADRQSVAQDYIGCQRQQVLGGYSNKTVNF